MKKTIIAIIIIALVLGVLTSCYNHGGNDMKVDTVTSKWQTMNINMGEYSFWNPNMDRADVGNGLREHWIGKIRAGYDRENITKEIDGNRYGLTVTNIEILDVYSNNEDTKNLKKGNKTNVFEHYYEYNDELWLEIEGLPLIPGEEYIVSIEKPYKFYGQLSDSINWSIQPYSVYPVRDYHDIPAYQRLITGEGLTHRFTNGKWLPYNYEQYYQEIMEQYGNK